MYLILTRLPGTKGIPGFTLCKTNPELFYVTGGIAIKGPQDPSGSIGPKVDNRDGQAKQAQRTTRTEWTSRSTRTMRTSR